MTSALSLLFVLIMLGDARNNPSLYLGQIATGIVIVASVINDGFNKIAKILKEKDV